MPPYEISIDDVDSRAWDDLLTGFSDASIYQSDEWGRAKAAVSHIVIRSGGAIVGSCQVRTRRLPIVALGIADISAGPLCTYRGQQIEPEGLACLIRAIKTEYGIKRGLMIRISPHARGDAGRLLRQLLENEGFQLDLSERPYRTLMLDLSPSLEEIRQSFLQKWRNRLNQAERAGLEVVEGTSEDLYDKFLVLAEEMCKRKNLGSWAYYQASKRIQIALPEMLKMRVMICQDAGQPVCAAVCSAIGDTGIYLFGATGEKGLHLNGSYLLQWRMIKWMKGNGVRYYDLGAFNPELNPGVYHFKLGIAGRAGWEETYLGTYHGCFKLPARTTRLALRGTAFLQRRVQSR